MADHDDFERLILALHSGDEVAARPAAEGTSGRLEQWLRMVAERGGSDLLLVAGAPPAIRVEGRVVRLDGGPLDGVDVEEAVLPSLPPHARQQFRDAGIADASFRIPGLARFRINVHHERGRAAAAVRMLPSRVPRLATLGLPPGVEQIASLPRGLAIIGGPTGSGKTTTLAAIVDEINRRDTRHVVTIEDPIEYEHVHHRSIIEQVEIGVDAPDFPTALRAALRQAPDVIVIGEMRDPETMRIALAAAETGHLVLTTLHTTDVASTVSRIADSFVAERQNTIRQELAMALAAVATQMLLPRTGGGLVPAVELLMARLRRPPAHSEERAAAPAPGDHDHPPARIADTGGIARTAGARRSGGLA